MKTKTVRRAGFTLVEIMIVVALIGLLAAIVLPNYVRARSNSQAAACINNLRIIYDASQQWALEYNKAPDTTVTFADIQSYLKNQVSCPAGGTNFASSYDLHGVTNPPTCRFVPSAHIFVPTSTN